MRKGSVVTGPPRRRPKGSFGPFVRQLRLAKGWNQAQLAMLCRVHQNLISRVESGSIVRPNTYLIFELAQQLSVTPEELVAHLPPTARPMNPRRARVA